MKANFYSCLSAIACATLFSIVLLLMVFECREVDGNSMEPTLHRGEAVFINKAAYGLRPGDEKPYIITWSSPGRGDLVVFRSPDSSMLVVKRCLGIAGDTLRVSGNTLYVGETALPMTGHQASFFFGYATVPPGTVFVSGDSLDNSVDSRDYGFIRIEKILGKVILFPGRNGIVHAGRSGVGIIAGDDGK